MIHKLINHAGIPVTVHQSAENIVAIVLLIIMNSLTLVYNILCKFSGYSQSRPTEICFTCTHVAAV